MQRHPLTDAPISCVLGLCEPLIGTTDMSTVVQSARRCRLDSHDRSVDEAMPQYKVLTQKDRAFSGKFDPAKLEVALNSYAEEGWRVATSTTATFGGMVGNREELIVILERD